jgi:AmiR/NasT family two-component response regulator
MNDNKEIGWQNPNRLLVLDDDEGMCNLVRRLAEQIGYQVTCVTTTEKFCEVYPQVWPTMVVLDLVLQQEDVLTVIDFIGIDHFPGGVILFTGYDHRFLNFIAQLGRDRGLNIMGTVEKGLNLQKLSSILCSSFLGPLPVAAQNSIHPNP